MRFTVLVSAIAFSCFSSLHLAWASDSRTSVVLKVASTSGFLGLGDARFIKITLSTPNGDTLISSESVNSGESYCFICESAGDWKIDDDFVKEEMPKLVAGQDTMQLSGEFGPLAADQTEAHLLLKYPKRLKIYQPINFTFPLGDSIATAVMKVPQDFWPGYPKLEKHISNAEAENSAKQHRSAIRVYDRLLADAALSIFPQYQQSIVDRCRAFEQCYQTALANLASMRVKSPGTLPQTITLVTEQLNLFRFIGDSLLNEHIGITSADSMHANLFARVQKKIKETESLVDSLQQKLNVENTQWILDGKPEPGMEFKYKHIIRAITEAYLAIDFSDTATKELKVVVPGDRALLLKKFNLLDPFETFVKLMNVRRKDGLSLFPTEFLAHLKDDSTLFVQPFYYALKAVNDYFLGNYAEAMRDVQTGIMRTSDEDLVVLLDELRLVLRSQTEKVPDEIVSSMQEARAASETGNTAKAVELYKTVRQMQENYAPAALALGEIYISTGDRQIASSMMLKAIQSDPWYVSAYNSLFENAKSTKNYTNVIDALTQARNRGADVYIIHYYLATSSNILGEFDDALRSAQSALALNNKSAEAFNQAGIAYAGLKRMTKAREAFRHATDIDPENAIANEYLKKLGEIPAKQSEPEEN